MLNFDWLNHRQHTLCVRFHIRHDGWSRSVSLMRECCSEIYHTIIQMTFKLPYTGRSIKYYTVPVVSSVVLGCFEGFWFCRRRPCNKNWQGRQLFPMVSTTHLAFCQKVPTSASRSPTSFDDVEAKMCGTFCVKNLVTQSILTLGKPCFVRVQVSNYALCTGLDTFPVPLDRFNRFCVTTSTRHSRFSRSWSRPTGD